MIDFPVQLIRQANLSQCWLAALQMIVKFQYGADATCVGHPTALQAGIDQENYIASIPNMNISELEKKKLRENTPRRGLNDEELPELAVLTLELPDSDGESMENEREGFQIAILREALAQYWHDRQDFYMGGNMSLYYSTQQANQILAEEAEPARPRVVGTPQR